VSKANVALTGASLLAFLATAFAFARASLLGGPRHLKRWWLLCSMMMQNILLILPGALISSRAVPTHSSLDWLLLGMLAASAGVQVVMVSPVICDPDSAVL
jgi:hypothetical protein